MSGPDLMTPGQVAALFGVTPKTIARWAETGMIPAVRTPGGQRRYPAAEIRHLAATRPGEPADPAP